MLVTIQHLNAFFLPPNHRYTHGPTPLLSRNGYHDSRIGPQVLDYGNDYITVSVTVMYSRVYGELKEGDRDCAVSIYHLNNIRRQSDINLLLSLYLHFGMILVLRQVAFSCN